MMVEPCSCNPLPGPRMRSDAIELYTEGDQLFEAIIEAIGSAQQQVLMETYIFAAELLGWSVSRWL